MMLAVVDDDSHVLERKTGHGARSENLLDAFLHRGDVLVRNRAALHLIDEFESGAAR
jgi:hypothetical protein